MPGQTVSVTPVVEPEFRRHEVPVCIPTCTVDVQTMIADVTIYMYM